MPCVRAVVKVGDSKNFTKFHLPLDFYQSIMYVCIGDEKDSMRKQLRKYTSIFLSVILFMDSAVWACPEKCNYLTRENPDFKLASKTRAGDCAEEALVDCARRVFFLKMGRHEINGAMAIIKASLQQLDSAKSKVLSEFFDTYTEKVTNLDASKINDILKSVELLKSIRRAIEEIRQEFAVKIDSATGKPKALMRLVIMAIDKKGILDMIDEVLETQLSSITNPDKELAGLVEDEAVSVVAFENTSYGYGSDDSRRITVDVINVGGVELCLEVNERHIRQIIKNLIRNAGKAGANKITITVDKDEGSGLAVIRITDNGSGIQTDQWESIFQAGVSSKTYEQGLHGYGLAICREMAVNAGGRLYVEKSTLRTDGNPDHGTTFRIDLPLHNLRTPQPTEAPTPHVGTAGSV